MLVGYSGRTNIMFELVGGESKKKKVSYLVIFHQAFRNIDADRILF